jgi:hypothetical protein
MHDMYAQRMAARKERDAQLTAWIRAEIGAGD